MHVNITLNPTPSRNYTVFIDELSTLSFDTKVMIVTNTTVADLHLETLISKLSAKELHHVILPDGEMYKNFESLNLI